MSRGFVKEDDLEHAGTDVPERPISTHPNYVTQNGYAQLQSQSEQLNVKRIALEANRDAPLSEQALAVINRDLRYISARLESAIVIDSANNKTNKTANQVLFGATVLVEDENGKQQTFVIVGEDEADIAQQKVSYVSPIAKALMQKKVGDNVMWQRPIGNIQLEILNINY